MAETIEKVELKPIEAAKISHYRSLPPGHYFSHYGYGRFYFLQTDGGLHLVEWAGKNPMISDFEVRSDGGLNKFVWDD